MRLQQTNTLTMIDLRVNGQAVLALGLLLLGLLMGSA